MTSPGSPVLNDANADTRSTLLNTSSYATTVVPPDLISQYEINSYYHGVSKDPPKLMWRSDFDVTPFRMPKVGERFFKPYRKTAFGIFNTRLNDVWDSVAPRILTLFKNHGIKYAALSTARFLTVNEDNGERTWGPLTIWIAVHPNTTNAAAVRDVTPEILQVLTDAQVHGAVVEWYEGTVERLVE